MWNNCTSEDQYHGLPAPEAQGWLKTDSGYEVDWEDDAVVGKIKATLEFLSKGCTCKSGCKNKRCDCVKSNRQCGASCECRGCTNMQLRTPPQLQQEEEEQDEQELEEELEEDKDEELESDEESDEEELETELSALWKWFDTMQQHAILSPKSVVHY